jgi:CelD/BcsL family acetyltransferase involved in cellulose biosynthesis
MQVVRLSKFAELLPWIGTWDALSQGVPFRRWEWLESWWRNYGQNQGRPRRHFELFVLAVVDENQTLLGIAPWYLERTASQGRLLRFLGSGEICSEYLSLMCRRGEEETVAAAIADWLTTHAIDVHDTDRWDVLKLASVETDDLAVGRLLSHLSQRGNAVYVQPGMNCWRLALPTGWAEYLTQQSKSHRKQLRRMDRDYFRSGRATMHWVHEPQQLDAAFAVLVDLHQRRWRSRGEYGCFSFPRFLSFHREVAPRLLAAGSLLMSWLELDGRPVAAEYHLAGPGMVYAYQSGIEPNALRQQPGRLSNLATIRRAIERGDQAMDFLRGDEPYKAHWGAVPRRMREYRVVPVRRSARVRQGLLSAGGNMIGWLKSGWQFAEHLVSE